MHGSAESPDQERRQHDDGECAFNKVYRALAREAVHPSLQPWQIRH
jgi:hypothetical protein